MEKKEGRGGEGRMEFKEDGVVECAAPRFPNSIQGWALPGGTSEALRSCETSLSPGTEQRGAEPMF